MRAAQFLLALLLTTAVGMPTARGADDWQPHPSHVPLPPPPPTPVTPKFPKPRLLESSQPQYPPRALRFNVQTVVRVRVSVNADGSVLEAEARGVNDDFNSSVESSARHWRFEPRPDPSQLTMEVRFSIGPDEVSSLETGERYMDYVPTDKQELEQAPVTGFAYIRLIIDRSGKVVDRYIRQVRPAEFEPTAHRIVDRIRFVPVPAEVAIAGDATLNEVLVDLAYDGVIRIQQRGGQPF